jgi:polyisoprenoid-binding protein YceI
MFAQTRRLAALVALPLLAAAKPVDGKPHVIDKAHSEINFVADSRLLSAHGFFGKWDADVKLDATTWSNSSVNITIDAASINTRVDMRDNHLKSADFFDVAKYPTITFKSTGVKQVSANKLDITGDLTVKGITKKVVVPASVVFYEKGAGRFRGTLTILRKDFGVSFDPPVNPIENEVQVQWDISLKEPAPTGGASK